MGLADSALLVKLIIRQWDGFRKDAVVSKRVDDVFHTAGGAGNYNKRLLSKGVLAPVASVATRIRNEHNTMTMPWQYNGVSLLPNKLLFEYKKMMDKHTDEFVSQVDNLVSQYAIHKVNQAQALGTMFKPDEYPTPEELRAKFSISWALFPVPQANHFIIDLEEGEMAKLKAEFSQNMADTNAAVKADLYERVIDRLEHTYERLADPQNVFRNSMTENLAQLAGVLPSLNVFDDPVLAITAERITTDILIAAPERLRDDEALRKKATEGTYDLLTLVKDQYSKFKKGP